MHITIERDGCISCGLCEGTCPSVFRIAEDGLAEVHHQPETAEAVSYTHLTLPTTS